jgi:tetratricopeptide (TPR) repeat protein
MVLGLLHPARPQGRNPQIPDVKRLRLPDRAARGSALRKWLPPQTLALGWCVVSLLAPADIRAAESPAVAFERANLKYERGEYSDALAAYTGLLDSGKTSAALCFNLGNASYKAGQLGRALLHYRQAERLAPRDPDIQANLRFTRAQVQGGPPPPDPLWRRWLPRLTLSQWTLLTASFVWGWLGLWSALQFKPAWKHRLKLALLLVGVGVALTAAGLFLNWRDQCLTRHAVVIQRETILRHGPLDESPSLQTLPDGQELVVLDQKHDWFQVAGASRGIGWLKTNQVALPHP